jgi:hypothetical protein
MKRYLLILVFSIVSIYTYGQVQYYSGDYTGNGAATQAITGVGFQPDVIIIKCDDNSAPIICTSTMTAGYSKDMTLTDATATVNTFMSAIGSDGFTVKLNTLNVNHNVYYFVCLKSSGACHVGSYVGNGANKAITGCGWQPEVVFIIPDHTTAAGNLGVCMSVRGKSIQDMKFSLGTSYGTMINSFDASGFTVAATIGSQNTKTYHYVAFNDEGTNFTSSTYSGTASASANITAAFKPNFVMVMDNGGSGNVPVARFQTFVGTKSFPMGANLAVIDMITGFNSSPTGFARGADARVNVNGNTFYYWGIGGTSTPTPVTFTSLYAICNKGKSKLYWSTSTEVNSKEFNILRSSDGHSFENVGKLSASGNSSQLQSYIFEDFSASAQHYYYKIKEIDIDGKEQESKTIVLNCLNEHQSKAQLAPNPYNENTSLTFLAYAADIYTIEIIDALGNTITVQSINVHEGVNTFPINLSNYANGIYLIKILGNDGLNETVKLIKNQ